MTKRMDPLRGALAWTPYELLLPAWIVDGIERRAAAYSVSQDELATIWLARALSLDEEPAP